MRLHLIGLLAAIAMQPATAGFFDGNKLNEDCQKSKYFAMGYVAGAFDAAETSQSGLFATFLAGLSNDHPAPPGFDKAYEESSSKLGTYCAPKGVILQQATDIFCQYLGARPGERHEPGNVLLGRALTSAWPCQPIKR